MSVQREMNLIQVTFKTERLPRTMEVIYPVDEKRLKLSLPQDHCFLVAVGKDSTDILGYLTMWRDDAHQLVRIRDLVIGRSHRQQGLGTKLLNVARNWARIRQLRQVLIETQTKNHPAIMFCQNAEFEFCGFNDQYFRNQDIAVFFGQTLR
jgi:GNAT superfamily N-acetyltransferase